MDAVQHFELPYKNRERAKKFYFQAFGWQIFDTPGSPYSFASTVETEKNGMPKRAGAINGGLTPRSKDFTAPSVMVKVTDLKSHLTRIEHAGGTVLMPPTAMGPVWFARFRDPEGNVLGAIQNRPEGMEQPASAKGNKTARKAKTAKGSKVGKTSAAAKPKAAKPKRKAKARKAKEPKATWSR
jgi:uncharacterized protein